MKKRIMKVARNLFIEKYDTFSIGDIMRELKMTRPAFYHYFKSKGELISEIINEGLRDNDNELITTLIRFEDDAVSDMPPEVQIEHLKDWLGR